MDSTRRGIVGARACGIFGWLVGWERKKIKNKPPGWKEILSVLSNWEESEVLINEYEFISLSIKQINLIIPLKISSPSSYESFSRKMRDPCDRLRNH